MTVSCIGGIDPGPTRPQDSPHARGAASADRRAGARPADPARARRPQRAMRGHSSPRPRCACWLFRLLKWAARFTDVGIRQRLRHRVHDRIGALTGSEALQCLDDIGLFLPREIRIERLGADAVHAVTGDAGPQPWFCPLPSPPSTPAMPRSNQAPTRRTKRFCSWVIPHSVKVTAIRRAVRRQRAHVDTPLTTNEQLKCQPPK